MIKLKSLSKVFYYYYNNNNNNNNNNQNKNKNKNKKKKTLTTIVFNILNCETCHVMAWGRINGHMKSLEGRFIKVINSANRIDEKARVKSFIPVPLHDSMSSTFL